MSTDILELPPVAHIVADLDEIEAEEAAPATFRAAYVSAPRTVARRRPSLLRTLFRNAAAIGVLVVLVACASTGGGATFLSGAGDTFLERPAYHAGVHAAIVGQDAGRIGHLAIAFQPEAAQSPIFAPKDGTDSAVDALLEEMNAFFDSVGVNRRLAVGRPSNAWVDWMREVMSIREVSRVLVLTLEVGERLLHATCARATAGVARGAPRVGGSSHRAEGPGSIG